MDVISNPFVILWLVLGAVVLALALYRKAISRREDDIVHLAAGSASQLSGQAETAQRMQKVDFWGKTLTIVLAAYGFALLAYFIYEEYVSSSKPVN